MRLAKGLEAGGFEVQPAAFFDTITIEVGDRQEAILAKGVAEGVNLRRVGEQPDRYFIRRNRAARHDRGGVARLRS